MSNEYKDWLVDLTYEDGVYAAATDIYNYIKEHYPDNRLNNLLNYIYSEFIQNNKSGDSER